MTRKESRRGDRLLGIVLILGSAVPLLMNVFTALYVTAGIVVGDIRGFEPFEIVLVLASVALPSGAILAGIGLIGSWRGAFAGGLVTQLLSVIYVAYGTVRYAQGFHGPLFEPADLGATAGLAFVIMLGRVIWRPGAAASA